MVSRLYSLIYTSRVTVCVTSGCFLEITTYSDWKERLTLKRWRDFLFLFFVHSLTPVASFFFVRGNEHENKILEYRKSNLTWQTTWTIECPFHGGCNSDLLLSTFEWHRKMKAKPVASRNGLHRIHRSAENIAKTMEVSIPCSCCFLFVPFYSD